MPYVLQQFKLSIGAFRKDRSAERFHNLLDGDILLGELILGGAGPLSVPYGSVQSSSYQTRPNAPIPTG